MKQLEEPIHCCTRCRKQNYRRLRKGIYQCNECRTVFSVEKGLNPRRVFIKDYRQAKPL